MDLQRAMFEGVLKRGMDICVDIILIREVLQVVL